MIGRKSLFYLVSTLTSSGLSFIGLFFMTRYLGADAYGTISWVMALMATINAVSDLGFSNAHIKRISEGKDINDCFSTFATIQIILTGGMIILTALSVLVWVFFLGGSTSATLVSIIIVFVLYYVLYDFANIASATFIAKMETVKGQIVAIINPIIRVPLVIFISVNQMAVIDLAFAYAIAALGVVALALLLLHRDNIKWRRPTLFRSYYNFAYPLALIAVVSAVSSNLDKLMIGFFGTATQVAYYTSSQTLLGMFFVIGTSVSVLAFPSFSDMHQKGNIESIKATTQQAERYISMIGMPIAILFFLFPSNIAIMLFGNDFAAAGEPIRFLAVSMMFTLLNSVYSAQILATNHPGISAKITIISFLVNAGLLLILVPKSIFGINLFGLSFVGAAIANMVSVAVVFITTRVIVRRLTGTKTNPRMLLHLMAAVASGISLHLFSGFVKINNLITLIGYGVLSVTIFLVALWVMGELKKNDVHYFLEVINPGKMRNYVSKEMHGGVNKP